MSKGWNRTRPWSTVRERVLERDDPPCQLRLDDCQGKGKGKDTGDDPPDPKPRPDESELLGRPSQNYLKGKERTGRERGVFPSPRRRHA